MKNQSGMSSLKLILIIALGILLASFIGCVASIAFTGAVLKGAVDTLQQSTTSHQQTRYSAPNMPISKIMTTPPGDATTKIIDQMGKEMQENTERVQQKTRQDISLNQPAYRNEIVRINSEKAVLQARNDTEDFDRQYIKPKECYNIKSSETRIRCANAYMRARAAFTASNR